MGENKRNLVFNILLTLSNILFPIVTFPYVSRVLGPEGIGKVQFIVTFAQYFALFAALGIPIYGIREVAKVKHDVSKLRTLVLELISIHFVMSLFVSAVYIVTILCFSKFTGNLEFYLCAIIIPFLGFSVIDWFYIGTEKIKFIAFRSILIKVLSTLFLFLYVKTGDDLLMYLCITIFSMMANNIWNIVTLNKEIGLSPVEKLRFKKHLSPLLVIFATSLSVSIYTVMDTLLLGFLSNDTAVGYYTAAVKFNRVTLPVIVAYGTIIIPQIVRSLHSGKAEEASLFINKSLAYVCFIGVPVSVGLFVFSKEFILLFSGVTFSQADSSMKILSAVPFLIGLNNIFGTQILISAGKDKSLLVSVTAGMLVSLVLNILLIPTLHEVGASLATLFSEIVVTGMTYFFVKVSLQIKFDFRQFVQAFISSCFFVIIALGLNYFNLGAMVKLLIGIAACASVYFSMQYWVFRNQYMNTMFLEFVKKRN